MLLLSLTPLVGAAPASGAPAAKTTRSTSDAAGGQSQANRVTFGIEPASAKGGDGRPFLSYGATPGATLSDFVAAVNYSSTALALQIYATDAVETTGGGYGLLPQGAKPTGVGAWISIPPGDDTVTVPPESSTAPGEVVIPIELRVPLDAQPGDHSGAIVASLSSLGKNAKSENIQLVQRVGTRLFVKVAGPAHPQLTLTVTHSGYRGVLNPVGEGRVVVAYTVKNTGNVNLGFDQSVAFDPLIGSTRTLRLQKVNILFPGAQVSETATFRGVFPAVLESRTITLKPFGSDSGGPGAPAVTSTDVVWAIPWTLIAVILLLVALAILYVYLRQRRRWADDEPLEPLVPDDLGASEGTEERRASASVPNGSGRPGSETVELSR